MSEADQLLVKIRKACTATGRDPAGRVIIRLTLDEADANRLLAWGEDSAESEGDGSFQPRPVSVGWLESGS